MPEPILPRVLQNKAEHCCAEQDNVKTCLRMVVFLCFLQEERNITCLSDWHNHKRTKSPFKHQSQFHLQESAHVYLLFKYLIHAFSLLTLK